MTIANQLPRASLSTGLTRSPIICFSHLRWDFVLQRPQHLMQRYSKDRKVFYFEEYIPTDHHLAYLEIHSFAGTTVKSIRPRIPHWWKEADRDAGLARLLDEVIDLNGEARPIMWFYTPLMYGFAKHVDAAAIVYDCMDELANFRFASPLLKDAEQSLMKGADVVFTGGLSLYDAKKNRHPNVHVFPSSVDIGHFRAGRSGNLQEPADQAAIAGHRLGYYGVIDERLDLDLIRSVASSRPDFSLIFLGPVVKISPEDLPRAPNIHYLGLKAYADLPAYLSGWNAALMPFALNDATRYISPTKTPEYLASGRPVVSTRVTDVVRSYSGVEGVFLADGTTEFIAACDAAIDLTKGDDGWIENVDILLGCSSWDKTFENMSEIVASATRSDEGRNVPVIHALIGVMDDAISARSV